MAGSGGSGRKKSGGSAAAASKNHAAASNTLSLDNYFTSSAKKDKSKKASNSNSSNATSSTPTFNPDQAARRMMGQETPQRNNLPAAAAAGTTAHGSTSTTASFTAATLAATSASTSPAVNPNRAAIERARQGKASHKHRGSSPSKNSRKRHKSSTSTSTSTSPSSASSSTASSSLSGSPRGSGSRSPTRSPTGRKNSSRSSRSSKTPTPAKEGPTIDLSMDSDEDHTAEGNAASASANANAKPAASKSAGGASTAGKKRKGGLSSGGDGNGADDGVFVIDDGDDNENRINGSEDSTLAKQQAKQQQRKRSKKGLGNVAGPTRGGTARSEVIDMAKSIDEDDEDEVVEVAAASAGAATTAAAAPTGKRKRGGVKSKVNNGTNGTAATAAKKPAVAAQSIPAAASSDSDVVAVSNGTTTASASASTNARSPPSTIAQASPPAGASAAAPGASSPAASNAACSSSQIAATDATHGLALVRIDRVGPATSRESIDLPPEARDSTANFHPLRIKAVLGRTGATSNSQPANKIDLGIGADADGVSRRQVRVKHISVQGLVVSSNQHSRHRPQIRAVVFNTKGTGASIFVGVAHYGPAFRYNMYRAGSEFVMNVGDCLVFDAYNGSTTGGRKNDSVRPAHVFRLVRYDKRDAFQAGARPPSNPAPAPALVKDSTADSTPPITTGAAKRSEDAPNSNSAAAAGRTTSTEPSVPSPSRSRKKPAARTGQNPADPPHIPASAESTLSSEKVVDTADIDKTVPRLGMPNIVVASMTQRQERPTAAAKPDKNIVDKVKSDGASRDDPSSLETSNTESAAAAESTTKKPSSKRKGNATKLPPQPSVGDRFRVNFEEQKNFFGVVETQWFCGTVEEVSSGNNRYEVNVRYDDGGIGRHEYPADDVGRLVDSKGFGAAPTLSASQGRSRRKTQADDSSQSMERVESAIYPEGSKEAVFDPNPSELFVGDLVDCFYQNGKIDGAWYRGRVARVQISPEAGKPTLFDVAYNDQEYEEDIPLEHGNVRLFQRGSDDLSWLYGADVLRRLGRSKIATKVGTVKSSPPGTTSSVPKVVVELNDGTFEEHVYTDIAQELFATYLQFVPAGKVKVWPASALDQGTGVKIELPETNENEEPQASDDEEHDDLSITKSKGTTRKTNAATFTSTQLDAMLNDHEASQDSQQSYPDSPVRGANDKPRAKEMHSSMANALWSALNSAEPSSSAILLRHSVACHHTLPNSALSQKMFNLMMMGPQNEGISFRDPNRMELAYDYMRLCLTSSHRLDVGPNITSFAPSSWEDVQHILAQPLQETEQMGTFHSIKESLSTSAMRRLGEALHTAASGLSCIDELLKDELTDGKEAGTTSNPRRLYMVNPTVRAALDANVREALKVAVRHGAQCWVRHGHFVIGDGDDLLPAESADEDWCAMEAKRCLDSLGSIISHLAWLYCAEEGIELSDNDCSFTICDALRNELESLHQDSADFGHIGKKKPSVASRKKYSKRAKMWFILSLDSSFASPLQQNLAKMLSLSKDLKPFL